MKKRIILNILIAVFGITFLVSAGLIIKTIMEYNRAREFYSSAVDEFFTITPIYVSAAGPTERPAEQAPDIEPEQEPQGPAASVQIDFDSIRAINPDVYAWIWIPDTVINYPVLQGDSNWTYLGKTFDGTPSNSGSIFLDYKNAPDFSDRNTVVYGHNMQSGDMFGSLKKFQSETYMKEHPYFYIFEPDGCNRYEIFCSAVTRFDSSVYTFRFYDDNVFSEHLKMLGRISYVRSETEVTADDLIVTLSTCTNGSKLERFVLVGRLANAVTDADDERELT
ncbi:MAG: class B sortase [Oscillospiraceae bacterium]|nr:class B sortase [Oscillospiraceae bacterium]